MKSKIVYGYNFTTGEPRRYGSDSYVLHYCTVHRFREIDPERDLVRAARGETWRGLESATKQLKRCQQLGKPVYYDGEFEQRIELQLQADAADPGNVYAVTVIGGRLSRACVDILGKLMGKDNRTIHSLPKLQAQLAAMKAIRVKYDEDLSAYVCTGEPSELEKLAEPAKAAA